MEEDLQKLLQGLQALTGGDGPTLDAFVSRDAAELLRERGTAPISEDDTVRYEVHPLDDSDIDQLQATVTRRLNEWSDKHAWRDAGAPCYNLKGCKAHLAAQITISDLDDEWLLVSLLAELTRIQRVACRETDSDGEFLLVDAADHLPDWLEPESAVGRTWLVGGAVAVVLHEPGGPLPLQKGLGLCASSGNNAASREATSALRRRERSLKEGAQTCVLGRRQNVVVSMPSSAWRVFRRAPRLLGPGAGPAPPQFLAASVCVVALVRRGTRRQSPAHASGSSKVSKHGARGREHVDGDAAAQEGRWGRRIVVPLVVVGERGPLAHEGADLLFDHFILCHGRLPPRGSPDRVGRQQLKLPEI